MINAGIWSQPELAAQLVSAAEATGFDSLWVGDHVAMPATHDSAYPYSPDGSVPVPADFAFSDPLIHLAWLSERTSSMLLGTAVLLLSVRSPIITAKQVASLDRITGGRVALGVGQGWLRKEFEMLTNGQWSTRMARLEEGINVMRALWSDDPATFSGEFTRFADVHCLPQPIRQGGPPIFISGSTVVAARRAGRLGDGYLPMATTPDETAHLVAEARRTAEEHGRDPAAIEVTYCAPPNPTDYTDPAAALTADSVDAYAAAGVTRIILAPPVIDLASMESNLREFLQTVNH
ncbi:LLM class F420-dependent oxidoreductase [Mycobacterium sp. E1747]|uniref:LLM class F420-dependent oxidoreductase n=1 Tax=Mycobacterium sp. E1747 TaxID=1834128 RepID=UPI0018D31B0A|nr:LLM class F420-dependent oxidoreductase [Mycobacterium sp. E1747]